MGNYQYAIGNSIRATELRELKIRNVDMVNRVFAMVKMIVISVGVIIDKFRVLLTRRPPTERRTGGWEFPGGKQEPDETMHDCLKRGSKKSWTLRFPD